jgi:hypothetical protein
MAFHGTRSAGSIAFVDSWANATQSETMPIPDLLRGLEALVVAVIGRDGSLQDANRGFLMLMTASASSTEPSDVRALFVNPRFNELLERRPTRFESTIHKGLLSFGTPGGKMKSLRGAVHWHDQDLVVVAEHDIGRLETLRTTVLELQDDLAMKQRHIMHLEHRNNQLQELADAALRDRDALLDALARRFGEAQST